MEFVKSPKVKESKESITNLIDSSNLSSFSNINDFKNEFLSALNGMESRIYNKYDNFRSEINDKMSIYNFKLEENISKFNDLNSSLLGNKIKIEKINDLLIFQKKTNDSLITHDVKVNNLQKDLSNACYKYDKIYLNNLVLPGIIGEHCKFNNLKEYLESNTSQIGSLITFKERQTVEFKLYKEKLDQMIKQMTTQLDNLDKNIKTYAGKLIEKSEENYKKEITEVSNKLGDLRIDNHKHSFNLQKAANDLTLEYEKILSIKTNVFKKFEESVIEMKNSNKETESLFENVKSEFDKIKYKFSELAEFIKDARFRKNIGGDITRQEIKKFAIKMTTDRKRSSLIGKNNEVNQKNQAAQCTITNESEKDIESYVKKYIQGANKNFEEKNKINSEINISKKDIYDIQSDNDSKQDIAENKEIKENEIRSNTLQDILEKKEIIINGNIDKTNTFDILKTNLNKSEDDYTNINFKLGGTNRTNLTNSSNMSVSVQQKFGNKFSNKSTNSNVTLNTPNQNFTDDSSSLLKEKRKSYFSEMEMSVRDEKYEKENHNSDTPTELMKNILSINGSLTKFKNEIGIKMSLNNKKIIEIDYNCKKRIEELACQIKNFIPINFNVNLKNKEHSQQLVAKTMISEEEKINEKNININIIDPQIILKNKEEFQPRNLVGNNSNNNRYFSNISMNCKLENKKNIINPIKLDRKSSSAYKANETSRINHMRINSRESNINKYNQTITEENDGDMSFSESIKINKKGKNFINEENLKLKNASIFCIENKTAKTKYIPLSTVLYNNPVSFIKNCSNSSDLVL